MKEIDKIRTFVEQLHDETRSKTGSALARKLLRRVIHFIDSLPEEPVSEDFEEALSLQWKAYNDRGASTVDALEDNTQELAFAKGFYYGANWKEQQMMINAAEGKVISYEGISFPVSNEIHRLNLNEGDKVKVLIIKED